ncbi:unnamed protein product, partial [marine sediment metagenome]
FLVRNYVDDDFRGISEVVAYQWTYKYDDIFPANYRFLPVG